MTRNIIKHIFIYILLIICIGCSDNIVGMTGSCSDCVLELEIPELVVDDNGYYHLEFDGNYIQTFTKIEAYVGIDYAYLGWESDTEHCVQMWNYIDCNDVVNPASYSGEDGYAHQMLGVHQEHIGDTINVHCGYYDDYGVQYLNNIRVIIDE
tara:strand:+ start:746 stop:1201 length:456 start_codon:yes stop_codon:yes gene_type:complete